LQISKFSFDGKVEVGKEEREKEKKKEEFSPSNKAESNAQARHWRSDTGMAAYLRRSE
jgi:hypothetical protein